MDSQVIHSGSLYTTFDEENDTRYRVQRNTIDHK